MSGILSWLFGSSKPPSPARSKLAEAKKSHVTDFGSFSDLSGAIPDSEIETPVGTYVCHHDGTFTDLGNRLMWIQAYWGMEFNGKKFKGEYLKLSWVDATALFGRGGVLPKPAGLTKEYLAQHGSVPYKPGSCRVSFAGYSDWRMPTAAELLTLSFSADSIQGYEHFSASKSSELRATLFPDCPVGSLCVWSANENGGYGWAADGQNSLGDY